MYETKKWIPVKNIILSLAVIALTIKILYFIGPCNGLTGGIYKSTIEKMPSFITYEIDSDSKLQQSFIPTYGRLQKIELVMMQVGDELPGELHVQLLNSRMEEVWSDKVAISELSAGSWEAFTIGRTVTPGKEYQLIIWTEDATQPVQVMVINEAFDVRENQSITYNGQVTAGGLAVAYEYKITYSLIGRVLINLCIGIAALYLLIRINRKEAPAVMKKILMKEGDISLPFYVVCLLGISLLLLYVHLYKLNEVPYGINLDEMGMGYDAWCIANFGVDRYLKSYPLYLVNFAGGQSVLYMYLTAALIKLFGYSEYLLRMPAVLNAFMTFFFGAKIVKEKWNKRSYVLIFSGLYCIFPIFIMLTRVGLDCNLMLGFTTMLFYCFIRLIKTQKKHWYVLSGIVAGCVLYTYALSYLILPVFLGLLFVYLLYLHKIDWKKLICFVIPLALLATPLILVQVVNLFDLEEFRIGCLTITKLPEYRGSEISFSHLLSNFYSTLKCFFQEDWLYYNSIPKYKTLYWFTTPFCIIGIFNAVCGMRVSIREKRFDISDMMFLWFLCMLGIGCLLGDTSGPNCNRLNAVYFVLLYFAVEGFLNIQKVVCGQRWYQSCIGVLLISYLFSFISFTEYYFGQYVEDSYPRIYFNTTYQEALQKCNTIENIADKEVIIQRESGDETIYFCGSALVSPYEFQYEKNKREYDNYRFLTLGEIEINPDYVYLIEEDNLDFAMELEKNGFWIEKVGTRFLCYAL